MMEQDISEESAAGTGGRADMVESCVQRLLSGYGTLEKSSLIAEARTGASHPDAAAVMACYLRRIAHHAAFFILPALDAMHSGHKIDASYFLSKLRDMPWIPTERITLLAKGLYAGYNLDSMEAAYLLVPQLENLVRLRLMQAGAKTSTIKNGIETENALATLSQAPEMTSVFGEDITYEISALFCGPGGLGPNLRNRLAHGWLGDADFNDLTVVYAWWFIFGLVFHEYTPEKQ